MRTSGDRGCCEGMCLEGRGPLQGNPSTFSEAGREVLDGGMLWQENEDLRRESLLLVRVLVEEMGGAWGMELEAVCCSGQGVPEV